MTQPVTKAPAGPVSAKVYNAGGAGIAVSLITWALVTYIPAFHSGIPPTLQPLIPAAVGMVSALLAGYFSKHVVTPAELEAAIKDVEHLSSVIAPVAGQLLSTHVVGTTEHTAVVDDGPGLPPVQ